MSPTAKTDWDFFMFTYHGGHPTIDSCAAWCRINRESPTYPKCNVFVHNPTHSHCYMGDIDKTGAPLYGLSGTSNVYFDLGTF
jgi:hypothetical protein